MPPISVIRAERATTQFQGLGRDHTANETPRCNAVFRRGDRGFQRLSLYSRIQRQSVVREIPSALEASVTRQRLASSAATTASTGGITPGAPFARGRGASPARPVAGTGLASAGASCATTSGGR